jgi:hypothetical protein
MFEGGPTGNYLGVPAILVVFVTATVGPRVLQVEIHR